MNGMARVVLDTNVIVSAVISDGKPRLLLRRGIENRFSMVTSDLMLKELALVLRRPKLKTNPVEIRRITLALFNSVEVVDVKSKLKVVEEDPKDDVVVETAVDGRADFIVTGDGHLLKLERFRGVKIMSVEEALRIL